MFLMKRFKYVSYAAIVCALSCSLDSFGNQWIVITSIQYPTAAVKQLAQLPGWRVVVVGDKKSPKDWVCEGCHYLSPEAQEELPYTLARVLPWNHYSRKMLGYLYAIEHGATVIYETDDDNELSCDQLTYFPKSCSLQLMKSDSGWCNVYALFGQPTVWPRGFPLMHIMQSASGSSSLQTVHPYIQQSLANGDPDVDAIFRLTRQGEVIFSSAEPVALAAQTYCPFNTQATFYHQEAFWGLYIPTTTPFRVCDIWRGYMAQRLLWDINGVVAFRAPMVFQERNAHNYLHDFADEWQLYTQAEKLGSFLKNWHCPHTTIEERLKDLVHDMIAHNFYKEHEAIVLQAWLDDLVALHYHFPAVATTITHE